LLDLAIAIFLDNLELKFYFDGEAYTPIYIYGLDDKRGAI